MEYKNMDADLSHVEQLICETQARLFEYVANTGADMIWFIERYMSSPFCQKEMDSDYSCFHLSFPEEILDFLLPQIGPLRKFEPGQYFSNDVANWLGFTYRQLQIQTQVASKELVQLLPPGKLCNSYLALSGESEEVAADILCERLGLSKVKREYNQD